MKTWTLQEWAEWTGATVEGPAHLEVNDIKPIDEAGPDQLTFLTNAKYASRLISSKAAAVLCAPDANTGDLPRLTVPNPYLALALILQRIHPRKRESVGIHPAASVDPSATIGKDCNIYPCAVIGPNAMIGNGVDVFPGTYIGADAVIGDHTVLFANVTVYHQCRIGQRCIIHSGTVIGSDGFGFATDRQSGQHEKIPQVGIVDIEDDVEIGSNCTFDRAAMGVTRIGCGTKIDNIVHVAHNVQVGKHCFIAGQSGVSGSSSIGDHSILAGQVGITGHVSIGNRVVIAAKSGVSNNVPDGQTYWGIPARPIQEMKRIVASFGKLPDLRKQVKELSKRLGGD